LAERRLVRLPEIRFLSKAPMVLGFFSRGIHAPDDDLLSMLTALGTQIQIYRAGADGRTACAIHGELLKQADC
jgi:hypothetical protein